MKTKVSVVTELCKGCLLCKSVCPKDVFVRSKYTNSRGYPYMVPENKEACIGCRQCTVICPDAAIVLETGEEG